MYYVRSNHVRATLILYVRSSELVVFVSSITSNEKKRRTTTCESTRRRAMYPQTSLHLLFNKIKLRVCDTRASWDLLSLLQVMKCQLVDTHASSFFIHSFLSLLLSHNVNTCTQIDHCELTDCMILSHSHTQSVKSISYTKQTKGATTTRTNVIEIRGKAVSKSCHNEFKAMLETHTSLM